MDTLWYCPRCGTCFKEKNVHRFAKLVQDELRDGFGTRTYRFVCEGCNEILDYDEHWQVADIQIDMGGLRGLKVGEDPRDGLMTLKESYERNHLPQELGGSPPGMELNDQVGLSEGRGHTPQG